MQKPELTDKSPDQQTYPSGAITDQSRRETAIKNEDFETLRDMSTHPVIKRFYELAIQAGTSQDNGESAVRINKRLGRSHATLITHAAQNMEILVDGPKITKSFLKIYFSTPGQSAERMLGYKGFHPGTAQYDHAFEELAQRGALLLKYFFQSVIPSDLFKVIHACGMEQDFATAMQNKHIPAPIRMAYSRWLKVQPAPVVAPAPVAAPASEPVAVEIPSPEETPEPITVTLAETPLVDSRVTYTDVGHALVTSGNRTESMGYKPVDEEINELGTSDATGDDNQHRTEKLVAALLADAESGVTRIHVRRDVRKTDDAGKPVRPYNLVDITLRDGSLTRVVVCDYANHRTYIERDAAPYVDNQDIQIAALRQNRKVWTAVHLSDSQWIDSIREKIYTPVDKLTVEDKNRSAWFSLKGALTSSFAATVMATGSIPATVDQNFVKYGLLADRTTIRKMYSACYEGRVDGIPPKTTFNLLFNALALADDAPMPVLNKFLNKPALTDGIILISCQEFQRDWGFAVEDGFFDALMIDRTDLRTQKDEADLRRTGLDADLAFQFKAVQVAPEKIAAWGRYPSGLEDFLELEGVIAPAPQMIAA